MGEGNHSKHENVPKAGQAMSLAVFCRIKKGLFSHFLKQNAFVFSDIML